MRHGYNPEPMSLELIQIIEDEPLHAKLLDHCLRQAQFRTNIASDGETGLTDVARLKPSVILLDLMLPEMSGYEVCREVRRNPALQLTPLIIITALDTEADCLTGLDLGADDYITKPFSPREVVSRVHALLRRSRARQPETGEVPGSPLTVRGRCVVASLQGRELTLSSDELCMLRVLTARPNEVVAEEELLAHLWSDGPRLLDRKLLHAAQALRRKVENAGAGAIEILAGIGYRFRPQGR